MSAPPRVRMDAVTQNFGSVRALDSVGLEVQKGTVHALLGENGAGKTTLMRVLYGALQPQSGKVFLDGVETTLRSPAEALRHGIGMVSQHYAIIPELTALDNLMLGAEGGAILDRKAARARAQSLADSMGFQFDWDAAAAELGPAGAQKLEILKLLWREVDVMILDEPTAMLSPEDADALYASLRGLADQGRTVIVVTHRLSEVTAHCDHVTILRQGKNVTDFPVGAKSQHETAELIVGKALSPSAARSCRPGEVLLETVRLDVRGDRGDVAVRQVDLGLRAGEVVGVAGVDGSGQRELVQALLGVRPVLSGAIRLVGSDITRSSARQRIALGLRGIPEDRHEEGVIDDHDLVTNATLGHQRLAAFRRGPVLDRAASRALAGKVATMFETKHSHLGQKMKELSGGNQQRFVNARALAHEAKVLVAFQPVRGLDIEATRRVYAALGEFADQGGAALVVSFDLDELLEFCDRIVVMHSGHLASPPTGHERDRTMIGAMMVGTA
ncbi:MAG: ABC transporter ATP-binding protein [Armatimonadetes bacterium]|nr:ABC transporter ATP-binding protein [Armatimonadota bacterium]